MDMRDNVLISGLIINDKTLTPKQIMQALTRGEKIKLIKAPKGVNFYLDDNQLKSEKITYLKGIPQTWFNPDIKYVIDYD